jgi:hypothetical protein
VCGLFHEPQVRSKEEKKKDRKRENMADKIVANFPRLIIDLGYFEKSQNNVPSNKNISMCISSTTK